ncbi:FAD-dependent oxidoreductase [bacterium]|nr:FAD-dependent oxidoreductase [bacterium]
MKIIILGAGLTGLSCAYHLKRKIKKNNNFSFGLYEKEDDAGGLCRSEISRNFIFDYTGHLLHLKSDYAKNLVKNLLKKNLEKIKRNAWIYSKETYTPYPYQANIYGLPIKVVKECVEGFLKTGYCLSGSSYNFQPDTYRSFYDWIINTFGEGFARHFMVPYNKKIWTVHPKEMTCEWMGKFVPLPKIREVLTGAFMPQGKTFGYNSYFYYPQKGGIQVLADALSGKVQSNLFLGKKIKEICLSKKIVEFTDGQQLKYDCLVSTLPLKEMILKIIKKVPYQVKEKAKVLKCNSVLNINLGINRSNISDKHWIYFPEKEFIFYRAGFPMNFSSSMTPPGTSSIYTEIAYRKRGNTSGFSGKMIDGKKLTNRVVKDLIKARVLKKKDAILNTKILNIKNAYVIYDRKHKESTKVIHKFLQENKIYSIGRYGGWKYSTMEDAILEGREIANNLCS